MVLFITSSLKLSSDIGMKKSTLCFSIKGLIENTAESETSAWEEQPKAPVVEFFICMCRRPKDMRKLERNIFSPKAAFSKFNLTQQARYWLSSRTLVLFIPKRFSVR